MEKRILEEQITYEDGVRVHRQVIEKRTTKAEDMLEVAQLHMTLGRLETQIETLTQNLSVDAENELTYKAQIKRLKEDQKMISEAITIHNEYIAGFNKEWVVYENSHC